MEQVGCEREHKQQECKHVPVQVQVQVHEKEHTHAGAGDEQVQQEREQDLRRVQQEQVQSG